MIYTKTEGKINLHWRDRSLITIKGDYAKVLEYIKENDLFDEATNDSSRLKLGSTNDIYRSATLGSVVPTNEGQHIGALCIRVGITVDDQNYQQWYYADEKEFMDFLAANRIAYDVPAAANSN